MQNQILNKMDFELELASQYYFLQKQIGKLLASFIAGHPNSY